MPLSRSRHSDPGRHATRTMPGACHTKAWKQGGTEMKAMEILVRYGYAVVFGTVLGEQIGLPIPAIPVMLAAGALVGGGHLNLMLLLALSGVASLMADTAWYWIGRAGGARVLGLLCRISLESDTCVRKNEGIFARHGSGSLLIVTFISGFDTTVPHMVRSVL